MSAWDISEAAAQRAAHWADREGALFASAEWAHVLEGLGCSLHWAWNVATDSGVLVPVFERWRLRMGYWGFPLAADRPTSATNRVSKAELAALLGIDLLRSNRSAAADDAEASDARLPEAWIDDLGAWSLSDHKKAAKDVAFANRAGKGLAIEDRGIETAAMHRLYSAVVRGHGGKVRYTNEYFARLAAAAESSKRLRVLHIRGGGRGCLGFAVLAMHGTTGYYLHGATDASARSLGISDSLLHAAIALARSEGMASFDLMASPPSQGGLVRFKSKWADREGVMLSTDSGHTLFGKALLAVRRASQPIVQAFRRG